MLIPFLFGPSAGDYWRKLDKEDAVLTWDEMTMTWEEALFFWSNPEWTKIARTEE